MLVQGAFTLLLTPFKKIALWFKGVSSRGYGMDVANILSTLAAKSQLRKLLQSLVPKPETPKPETLNP